MSTKIYNGYKVPLPKLGEAIEWFRISMWRRVVASFQASSMDEIRKLREEHAECGFHVWVDTQEQEALICLFGLPCYTEPKARSSRFSSWKFPAWIEEFGYWNNTDAPKKISRNQWEARGKQWDRVATGRDRWEARMMHIVLPKDGYADMNLGYELLAAFREAWEVKPEDLLSQRKLPK